MAIFPGKTKHPEQQPQVHAGHPEQQPQVHAGHPEQQPQQVHVAALFSDINC